MTGLSDITIAQSMCLHVFKHVIAAKNSRPPSDQSDLRVQQCFDIKGW